MYLWAFPIWSLASVVKFGSRKIAPEGIRTPNICRRRIARAGSPLRGPGKREEDMNVPCTVKVWGSDWVKSILIAFPAAYRSQFTRRKAKIDAIAMTQYARVDISPVLLFFILPTYY